MPAITRNEAVSRISGEIERSASDDLVEIHNELFPDAASLADEDDQLIGAIRDRIQAGLEVEEIVDLWNIVFPKDRNVWYDDENESLHFNEEPEYVESTE